MVFGSEECISADNEKMSGQPGHYLKSFIDSFNEDSKLAFQD